MHLAEPVHQPTLSSFSKRCYRHIWIASSRFQAEYRAAQRTKRSEVMKISSILRDLLALRGNHADVGEAWADDPYGHPDIDAMTERERGDLPPTHMPARRAMGAALRPASCS
jgi:hypothetical protein